MYTDKRLEKPQPTPTLVPSPVAEMHHHLHQQIHHLHQHSSHHSSQHLQHIAVQQQQQQHHHQQQQQQLQQHQHQIQHQQQQQQQQPQSQQHQTQHGQQQQQQQQSTMFTRFDANKSTKGASKLRRDLINAEITNLRDLLPLPQSTRQRLSQLQLMALVCVYVRKANYFQQVFKRHDISIHHAPTPNIGFSKALSGFLMMLTQNGKLLYISDNAAEYLGHSMEDLLIHGDSVYDIIDKQDHGSIQAELNRNVPQQPGQHTSPTMSSLEGEHRMFLCRMNVSRNARRQMRFGDQKVVLVQGHYLSFLPLCSRNEPVFVATCTPIAMPETRECVVQGATNVFTTIHSMDMKIAHIDKNGEFHLGYSISDIQGLSWYNLIHSDNLREAQNKHRLITQSEQDRSCILLVRMQRRQGEFIWVHVVLQVRDSQDTNQQPVIVCTNQVLNDREATVMVANSWLYHYYSVQSKIQFGVPFGEGPTRVPPTTPVYYHHHHQHHHHHSPTIPASLPPPHVYPPHHPHHHQHHQYHRMPYGPYHSPVSGGVGGTVGPISSSSASSSSHIITGHYSNESGTHTANGSGGGSGGIGGGTPYAYHRIESSNLQQPVDYSQVTSGGDSSPQSASMGGGHSLIVDNRCGSANSSVSSNTPNYPNSSTTISNNNNNSNNLGSPPPAKKRAIGKLEPLYIVEDSPESVTELETHYGGHSRGVSTAAADYHGSVVFATVVPTRPRLLTKALPPDPPDFIDQWNPSPPWSEAAQKISLDSSSSQQELSPCITTTPPTPTSAPHSVQALGPAFSFEWMSDQFVPIMDAACGGPCVSCLTPDGIPIQVQVQMPLSHHHHHWTPATTTMPEQPLLPHHHHHYHHQRLLQNLQNLNGDIPVIALPPEIITASAKIECIDDSDEKDSSRS